MQRFKRIVVNVDSAAEKQPALKVAAWLARQNQAALHVIHCCPRPSRMATLLLSDVEARYEATTQALGERLETLAKPLAADGLTVEVSVLRGRDFLESIREVIRGDHDLLVKSAAPESGIRSLVFGATDWHLIRKCPCPLWLEKPTAWALPKRVLAAVDPAPGGSPANPLATKVLELASSIAAAADAELFVGHAWSCVDELVLAASVDASEKERFLAKAQGIAKNAVVQLIADVGGEREHGALRVVKGHASHVIPKIVDAEQ
ncbi:MAG: universal stress protein, partial [Planctomycetota bacterium]